MFTSAEKGKGKRKRSECESRYLRLSYALLISEGGRHQTAPLTLPALPFPSLSASSSVTFHLQRE